MQESAWTLYIMGAFRGTLFMTASLRLAILGLTLAAVTLPAQPGENPPPLGLAQLREGMSARQARDLVGQPSITARQVFSRGHIEQWIYEKPQLFRIDVLHAHGLEPVVKAIHPPVKARPR